MYKVGKIEFSKVKYVPVNVIIHFQSSHNFLYNDAHSISQLLYTPTKDRKLSKFLTIGANDCS